MPERLLLKLDWRTRLNRAWRERVFLAATREFANPRSSARSIGIVFAYLVASVVFLATGVFAAAGIYLILFDFPNLPAGVIGSLLLALAYAARPHLEKENAGQPRGSYPALEQTLDRISEALNAPKITTIEMTSDWNAKIWQSIGKKEGHLVLGVPLLYTAPRSARLAILAHEVAHLVNGDPKRGAYLAAARHTLTKWLNTFGFDEVLPPNSDVAGAGEVIRQVVAFAVFGLRAVMDRGVFYDSQKAEYLADALGAQVAGNTEMRDALLLTAASFHLNRLLQTFVPGSEARGVETLRMLRRCAQLPAEAVEERHQRMNQSLVRTDLFHPPTAYRLAFLETLGDIACQLNIEDATWADIESELDLCAEALGAEVLGRREVEMPYN